MPVFSKRKQIYVNTELQFKYSVILIIVVTIESVILAVPFSYAFKMLVSGTAEKLYLFYPILLLGLGIITVLNIFLGAFLSHKIAGPIYNFEQKMKAITNGDLGTFVELRQGDELKDVESTFNEMIKELKKAIHQDRDTIKKINEKLKKLDEKLNNEETRKSLQEISNDMKEITAFFKL
ncbi:MAG: methyl-accepting chemotaxis protein [Candidatus Firestonebacteria bacterium]